MKLPYEMNEEEMAIFYERLGEAIDRAAVSDDPEVKLAVCRELAALAEGFGSAEEFEAMKESVRQELVALREEKAANTLEIERLRAVEAELTMLKKKNLQEFFERQGAIDGEYLAEKMAGSEDLVGEELIRAAKERYPALFRRKVVGVRPMEIPPAAPVGKERLSFAERMRMFADDPEGYRAAFGK